MTGLISLVGAFLLLTGASAITQDELDQFSAGDGHNRTVEIVDNGDGTVTFSAYRACTEHKGLLRRLLGAEFNCSEPVRLSVNKVPVVPDAPATCVPRAVIGFSLDGRPLMGGGFKRGSKRGGKRGRKGRKGRRGRSPRHARRRDSENNEESEEREEWMSRLVEQDALLGVALDGFPIYSANASEVPDRLLGPDDLDQCGGRCDADGNYRYHFAPGRPPMLGCVRGEPVAAVDGECEFHIACNYSSSANSCAGGQAVPEEDYTCVEPRMKPDDSSSESSSDEESRGRGRGRGGRGREGNGRGRH